MASFDNLEAGARRAVDGFAEAASDAAGKAMEAVSTVGNFDRAAGRFAATFLAVAYAWSVFVIDDGDDASVLDIISVLYVTYLIHEVVQ